MPYESVISFWSLQSSEGSTFPADFHLQLGVRVDALSAAFMSSIAFVAVAVQWYATTYLRRDARYRRFFRVASILTAAALWLAASPNLFTFLVMWEAVAVTAYLLVAHWWHDGARASAARRVFLHLRVGDALLLLAVVLGFVKLGAHAASQPPPPGADISDPFSFSILGGGVVEQSQGEWHSVHLGMVPGTGPRTLALLAVLFVLAGMLRAAHFPFHAWLVEATRAPLPALALISTAVTSGGILLLARVYPLFLETPYLLSALAIAGTLTAVFAASVAAAQRDAVRLAIYAGVAQLGLAGAALGMGGFSQGLFVLFTFLPLTALVFLALSGLTRAYESRDLGDIGGAWHRMRWTSLALVAWAAGTSGAGLAGFSVLSAAAANVSPAGGLAARWLQLVLLAAIAFALVLNAFAPWRLVLTVCPGTPPRRRGFRPERIAEVVPRLRSPMVGLTAAAAMCVLVGIPGVRYSFSRFVFFGLHRQTAQVPAIAALAAAGLTVAVTGAGTAWLLARRPRPAALSRVLARLAAGASPMVTAVAAVRVAARSGLWVAPAMQRAVTATVTRLGALVGRTDRTLTDPLIDAAGRGVGVLAEGTRPMSTSRLRLQITAALVATLAITCAAVLVLSGHLPTSL